MSQVLTPHSPSGIIIQDPVNQCALMAFGSTVPTDATAGYQIGCIFIQTDGVNDTTFYVNEGTATSCDFNAGKFSPLSSAMTAAATTITITDAAGTPDYALSALTTSSPYGLATAAEAITLLYVIQNLQVRMAEVEAALEANGIVTAN